MNSRQVWWRDRDGKRVHNTLSHPLSGCEFEALTCKEYSGEQRVCFLDKKGRQCEIPLSWTDLAVEDPVRVLASGKSWFRAVELVELARLVEGLRR